MNSYTAITLFTLLWVVPGIYSTNELHREFEDVTVGKYTLGIVLGSVFGLIALMCYISTVKSGFFGRVVLKHKGNTK